MKNLILLFMYLFSTHAFTQTEAETVPPTLPELVQRMKIKRKLARTWAPYCADGTQSHNICPFADMAIFSGMMCLAGEKERCEDVRRAQGPDGRWWRSPSVVGDDSVPNTFSRDQAKGVLAYLVATKDVAAAKRWQKFLNSNNLKMCKDTTDNRCHITQGTGRLFGAVWRYLGLKTAKWMNKGKWSMNVVEQILARTIPSGFPMHLSALDAWIRLEIERRGGPRVDSVDQKVVKILLERQPTNPYFMMLRKGPTIEVAKLILEKCPNEKPASQILDWAWQRDQDDMPWLNSSGHDCIFIVNMFERELSIRNQSQVEEITFSNSRN